MNVTSAMESMMMGMMSDEEIEAFLMALRKRGETVSDLIEAAKVMRRHSLKLTKQYPNVLDTCGTGGDSLNTINVSTLAAITASAANATVAKHGNRSVSSLCGSADLLEMFGMRIDLPLEKIEQMIEKVGFGFFFAPIFHASTKAAMPARKRIGGKTIFNVLGPLSNPAGAQYQLMGVYERRLVPIVAEALVGLGIKRALVVYGDDGMDEISMTGKTSIAEVKNGDIDLYKISPEDVGYKSCSLSDLQCSSKQQNKEAAYSVLSGVRGPQAEIVCLNAGAALFVAEKVASIREGAAMARGVLDKGAALEKLNEIVEMSK